MECTQRLECTQEIYATDYEKVCPEQIGFLGICGKKYPVKKGPNKIGRDPTTCSIVLNLNSISRQHAVINVINNREYMVMDLDSANKTKLLGKAIPPYIPHKISNGDMLQFGDIFGIFRLLEDENELPSTQVLDIPDTPIIGKHASRINQATTIPESPDVSDKDDSFIGASQPKKHSAFKTPNNNFIKPSSKIISIQPIGNQVIDNVYWNSSKKSKSLDLLLNDSSSSNKVVSNKDEAVERCNHDDIHEMETQLPYNNDNNKSIDIYEAATQLPTRNIHNLDTQSIHNLDTQVPSELPEVCKINAQQEMKLDLFSISNANDNIFEANTQLFESPVLKPSTSFEKKTLKSQKNVEITEAKKSSNETESIQKNKTPEKSYNNLPSSKINALNEEILLDEIDCRSFDEDFESQPIEIPEDVCNAANDGPDKQSVKEDMEAMNEVQKDNLPANKVVKPIKTNICIDSDSSTDCEDFDILPSQKDPEEPAAQDDINDCEDNMTVKFDSKKSLEKGSSDQSNVEHILDDEPTQIVREIDLQNSPDIIDIPTQIVHEKLNHDDENNDEEDLELTQIVHEKIVQEDKININKSETSSVHSNNSKDINRITHSKINPKEQEDSPFKVPFLSPRKTKRKDGVKVFIKPNDITNQETGEGDNVNYYDATQDILEDLCTPECSPEIVKMPTVKTKRSSIDDIVPSSIEVCEIGERFPHIEEGSPRKTSKLDKSFESSDGEQKALSYAENLTNEQARNVLGIEVQPIKKMPSDPSDSQEDTPKKVRPFKMMYTELPDSQEIKSSVSFTSKIRLTSSSSESEPEQNSEDNTPILFRDKKIKKTKTREAKVDLTKRFNAEKLPTRVLTRQRKPSRKLIDADENTQKMTQSILKPKFLTEHEDHVNNEIITENISRLKNKNEKTKENKESLIGNSSTKLYNDKKEIDSNIPTDEIKLSRRKGGRNKTTKADKDVASHNTIQEEETVPIKTTRSTRNKQNTKNKPQETSQNVTRKDFKIDTASDTSKISDQNEKSDTSNETIKTYERRTRNHRARDRDTKKDSSPEDESIRRSKRQRTSKDKKSEIDSSKLSVKCDQSTVYNISSESGAESPRSLKRSSSKVSEVPSPKRPKSAKCFNSSGCSLRATPSRLARAQKVLFTAFPDQIVKQITPKLQQIGASIVSDVLQCSVLVTTQIKRTFKLLCAVGLGRPVVGAAWVQACLDTGVLVDPWLYVIKDEVAEARLQFSLEQTLRGPRHFLKGLNVSATPKVMPSASEMKLIVESSGGTWKEGGAKWVCVSCGADRAMWPDLKLRGAMVVSAEFILGGVLRQKLDIEGNMLK